MSWLDRLLGRPDPTMPSPPMPEPTPRLMPPRSARALAGKTVKPGDKAQKVKLAAGRTSVDDTGDAFAFTSMVAETEDAHSQWATLDLDAQSLMRSSPSQLIDLLCEVSPEVSRALWDFLRMCNPGWEVKAHKPGTHDPDDKGQEALDLFLKQLKDMHGSADLPINRLFMSAFRRGAICSELVLDQGGRVPIDLAVPDPSLIQFKSFKDPVRGKIWKAGQQVGNDFIDLDIPTFRYAGIDTMPGKAPYGRPIANPAIFVAVFLVALLHDVRRVIQQQGYPRVDVVVDLQALVQAFPAQAGDPEAFRDFVNTIIDEVKEQYSSLQPDDAYIHTSAIQVNQPVGVDASSLGAISTLIATLERQAVRALKTMPLIMGITDGVSEANANRQWEIHAAGIKSLQHIVEAMLEYQFELALQAQGIQADVEFRFAELRAAEELRDQQTLAVKVQNYGALLGANFVTREEASMALVGHEPALSEEEVAAKQEADQQKAMRQQMQQAMLQVQAQQAAVAAQGTSQDGQEQVPPGQADQGSQRSILSHDIQQTLAQLQAILAPYGISLDDGEA